MTLTRLHFLRLLQVSIATTAILTTSSTWCIEITPITPSSNNSNPTFQSSNSSIPGVPGLPSRSFITSPTSNNDDKIGELIAERLATESHSTEPAATGSVRTKLQNLTQAASGLTQRASELAMHAMGMLGINYKRGGNTPETGLDCSGMVRYVYKQALGRDLPRSAIEISQIGKQVQQQDLQPGDLVFYNTMRRGFSHVGIYLGDNKFIHSPSAGGQVRIESMELAYWKKRFNGARHVND